MPGIKKEIEINHVSEKIIIADNRIFIRKDDDKEDLVFLGIIKDLVKIIAGLEIERQHQNRHGAILTLQTLNKQFIMADITLTLGGTMPTGVFTLLDGKDGSVNDSAVFSNKVVGDNSNPEFATFALDDSGNVVPTAIAEGSGTIGFTAHADYTDKGDGSSQSADFSVTKNFSVVAGAPTPNGATLDVVFS